MTKTELQAMTNEELEKLQTAVTDELARRCALIGLKAGDWVRHRNGTFRGQGQVISISKSGKSAKVRAQELFGFSVTNYLIEKLEPVRKMR